MSSDEHEQTSGAGKTFLSSSDVVERLGISKSTLYAYVSRGLIRSEPDPGSPRTRRYRADDVERLLNRQRLRSDPEQAASTALNWGVPLLESEVSSIVNERLYYRDHNALELARSHSFEQVTGLLWSGDLEAELPDPDERCAQRRGEIYLATESISRDLDIPARVQMLLPLLEQRDPASYDFRDSTVFRVGVDILRVFIASLTGSDGHSGIARTLQAHWAPGQSQVEELLDAALILSADHELNISTFTVRCIASARSPLHSAVAGGLSAMRGRKHGGAILQAEAMVSEIGEASNAYTAMRARLQRGENLAGFGHQLYPSGDPRGAMLLAMLREQMPDSPEVALAEAICESAVTLQGSKPNLDFGLVALCRALGRPDGTALALMAMGRTAGWVAHAREEYARDQLIRPRARSADIEPE